MCTFVRFCMYVYVGSCMYYQYVCTRYQVRVCCHIISIQEQHSSSGAKQDFGAVFQAPALSE